MCTLAIINGWEVADGGIEVSVGLIILSCWGVFVGISRSGGGFMMVIMSVRYCTYVKFLKRSVISLKHYRSRR